VPPTAPHPGLFQDDDQPRSRSGSARWTTAHCDGGARGNPGPAGYGAVLTDASGHVLAELSEFLGVRTNNYAEYAGLLACLQWTLDHDHFRLRVISDSLLMVNQIQGKYKINSPDLRPLWEEARRRIARLEASHPEARFEIAHALRHKNKDADRLANQAMDRGTARGAAQGQAQSLSPAPGMAAKSSPASAPNSRVSAQAQPTMLRGFTRDGAIHLLGGVRLPDGVFVKVIPE
jgi:ribonuclease HI